MWHNKTIKYKFHGKCNLIVLSYVKIKAVIYNPYNISSYIRHRGTCVRSFCMFDSHSYINIFMLKGTFKFFGKLIRFDNQVTGLYFTKTVCHYLRFLKLTNEKLQMYEDFTCNFYGRIPKGLNCYFSIQLLFKL